MLVLTDFWVWDSWYVEHAGTVHAFYLTALRSLGDPQLRHANARIGHSSSTDLVTWTRLPDALGPGAAGQFDDLAVWTGSVVRDGDTWHMFYTGVDRAGNTAVQRVGHATSTDLLVWKRASPSPVVSADPRWYATAQRGPNEPWRDPWVFRNPDDGLWHMLVTAGHRRDAGPEIGTIGHCVSSDLRTWRVAEPLATGYGFRQLEVTQVVQVDDRSVLVFCAAASDVLDAAVPALTGTYSAPAEGPLGPYHLDRAEPIGEGGIYAGRVVVSGAGEPVLLGFVDSGAAGGFAGVICDPIRLGLTDRGTLQPLSE